MNWYLTYRADPRGKALADRHYNRQNPDSAQYVPPGRCIVLLTQHADALWITSAPFAEWVKHEWAGAWVCSCFRNENQYNRKNKSGYLSSRLITEAVAVTRWYASVFWNEPTPALGFITFIDASQVRSKIPGTCYLEAGWRVVGNTKINGLLALQLLPEAMPEPALPNGATLPLFEEVAS